MKKKIQESTWVRKPDPPEVVGFVKQRHVFSLKMSYRRFRIRKPKIWKYISWPSYVHGRLRTVCDEKIGQNNEIT